MLLHFWRRGVGDTEKALRSLAALFNAGTAAGLYMWGRQVGGPWAGWTAGLLWTFSLLGQTIGREARAYALLSCLTVGAHLLFWRWVRTHKGFFLWLASLWALFHTHYMGGDSDSMAARRALGLVEEKTISLPVGGWCAGAAAGSSGHPPNGPAEPPQRNRLCFLRLSGRRLRYAPEVLQLAGSYRASYEPPPRRNSLAASPSSAAFS